MATRKWGNEKLVNKTTSGNQLSSDIAVLADGSFVIVWQDDSSGDTVIRAQRYDAAGKPLGSEMAVVSAPGIDFVEPSVTALADGSFYVTCTQAGSPDNYIVGAVYDANGTFVRNQTVVFAFGQDTDSQAVQLGNGSAVAWADPDAGDIYFRIFDAAGAGGALLTANTSTTGVQLAPAIAVSPVQIMAIVWADNADGTIQGRLFDTAGNGGDQFRIDAPSAVSLGVSDPVVTWLSNYYFVVVWSQSNSFADGQSEIKASIFNGQAGPPVTVTGNIAVNSTLANSQLDASVTALPNGGFVVCWWDTSGVGIDNDYAIRLQSFDGAGTKIGGEIVVNTTTAGTQSEPSVSALPDGRVVVSWTDWSGTGGDTSGSAIRMQIIDPRDGIVTGTSAGETLYGHDNVNDEISAGAGNDILDGMRGDDALYGGEGDDTLKGGIGADIMYGGTGNDSYIVDNAGDGVIENPDEGTDTVKTTFGSYTLDDNVENLTFTGNGNFQGYGNNLKNLITGGAYADTLNGGNGNDTLNGRAGSDSLSGGAGRDNFVFDTALKTTTNVDTIFDFSSVDDKVLLSQTIFPAAGPLGTLGAGRFVIGTAAADTGDRIIYDSSTGALKYDPDGTGAGAATRFATLPTGLALTNANFRIV